MKKLNITLLLFLMFFGTLAQTIHRDTSYIYDYQVIDQEVWCKEKRIIHVDVQTVKLEDTLTTEKIEIETLDQWKVSILPSKKDNMYIYDHNRAKKSPGEKIYAHVIKASGNFEPYIDIKIIYGRFFAQREEFEIRPYVIYHEDSNSFDYGNDISSINKARFSYGFILFIAFSIVGFFYLNSIFTDKEYHKRYTAELFWRTLVYTSIMNCIVVFLTKLFDLGRYTEHPAAIFDIAILWIASFAIIFVTTYLRYKDSFKFSKKKHATH